jgi:hypothetical protein
VKIYSSDPACHRMGICKSQNVESNNLWEIFLLYNNLLSSSLMLRVETTVKHKKFLFAYHIFHIFTLMVDGKLLSSLHAKWKNLVVLSSQNCFFSLPPSSSFILHITNFPSSASATRFFEPERMLCWLLFVSCES